MSDNILTEIEHYIFSARFLATIIIIAIAVVSWIAVRKLVVKGIERRHVSNNLKGKIHIAETVIKAILTIALLIIVLQVNGINVSALVTGMGITSIIIGFALQDLLKDWIMGISIFWNDFYNIGDIIQIDDTIGKVIKLSLKCTKIKDIYTHNIVSISNREIMRVQILSDFVDVYVSFAYEVTTDERERMLQEMTDQILGVESVTSCDALGIQEFRQSDITELLRIHMDDVTRKPQVKRDAQTIVKRVYENSGYSIPYSKVEVMMK